jgi:hypothetical protein
VPALTVSVGPGVPAVAARMTWMSGPIGVQPTAPVSTQNAIAPG